MIIPLKVILYKNIKTTLKNPKATKKKEKKKDKEVLTLIICTKEEKKQMGKKL